ncbi:hypothetical protein HDU79_003828 [Rhizoclosmatium sp. JEL0117]|nr:hypothetical protein HDU79_003828 [Rhizoclosmatium sp. JEL0117]
MTPTNDAPIYFGELDDSFESNPAPNQSRLNPNSNANVELGELGGDGKDKSEFVLALNSSVSSNEAPLSKLRRLRREAIELKTRLGENENENENENMLHHIQLVLDDLATIAPLAEARAKNGPLSQTQAELLDPTNNKGKQLIKQLKSFSKYADKLQPNPFVRNSIAPLLPLNAHQSEVYNLLYAQQDPDEFLPDLSILDHRISVLESTIGAALPQQPPPSSSTARGRATSSSSQTQTPRKKSPLPLPRHTPATFPLQSSLADTTTHLHSLLETLTTSIHTDPKDITSLLDSISLLQHSQKLLKETTSPFSPPSSKDTSWKVVAPRKKRTPAALKDIPLPPHPASSKRLLHLQETLSPLDKLSSSLPTLFSRLESLSPLHTRASLLADALQGVVSMHRKDLEDLTALEGVVHVLDENLRENVEVCERNWGVFDARIKELEARFRRAPGVHVKK